MVWIIIGLVWILILIVSFFGDYEEKERKRDYEKYWWATGFVWGQLTKYSKPRTELKAKNRITFKSEEMANLFVQGLREAGFVRAVGSDQLVDDSFLEILLTKD